VMVVRPVIKPSKASIVSPGSQSEQRYTAGIQDPIGAIRRFRPSLFPLQISWIQLLQSKAQNKQTYFIITLDAPQETDVHSSVYLISSGPTNIIQITVCRFSKSTNLPYVRRFSKLTNMTTDEDKRI
jgi:hypothetical protein